MLPGLKLDAHVFPEQQRPAVQRSINSIGDKQRREEVQVYVQHLQELQVQATRAAVASQQKVVEKRMDKEDSETRSFQPGEWVICPWRGGKPNKLSVTYFISTKVPTR